MTEPSDIPEPEVLQIRDLGTPATQVSRLELRREQTAARLAYGLLGLFALTVLPPLLYWLVKAPPPAEVLTYIKDIATVETTLLGVTFGFYFSQRRLGDG